MLDLDIDQQFAIHATAIAIKEFDREELEEAFVVGVRGLFARARSNCARTSSSARRACR